MSNASKRLTTYAMLGATVSEPTPPGPTPIYDALVIERAGQEAREYVRTELSSHLAPVAYDDDRPGMMRVHIAQERAQALCEEFTRNELRFIARQRQVRGKFPRKFDLALALVRVGVKA